MVEVSDDKHIEEYIRSSRDAYLRSNHEQVCEHR